jgi:hypothetical protein
MNDFADEIAAKQALHRGGLEALNVYTGTAAGNIGFAYFPKTAKQFPFIDGIVIHYGSVPGGSIANFNLGHTATHETGHWLGLWHTFDFGCQGQGDKVSDTPQMSVPTSGCPEGQGHLRQGPRARSDPQLHGLLFRLLLRGVHARPDRAYAAAVRPLPVLSTIRVGAATAAPTHHNTRGDR